MKYTRKKNIELLYILMVVVDWHIAFVCYFLGSFIYDLIFHKARLFVERNVMFYPFYIFMLEKRTINNHMCDFLEIWTKKRRVILNLQVHTCLCLCVCIPNNVVGAPLYRVQRCSRFVSTFFCVHFRFLQHHCHGPKLAIGSNGFD